MFTQFIINNFRCFHYFDYTNVNRINLISGKNNVGKTALLEALFLHTARHKIIITNILLRGTTVGVDTAAGETIWDSIFSDYNHTEPVTISGMENGSEKPTSTLKISVLPPETTLQFSTTGEQKISPDDLVFTQNLMFTVIEDGKTYYYTIKIPTKGQVTFDQPKKPVKNGYLLSAITAPENRENAELYGRLDRVGRQDEITQALQMLEPSLKRLSVITIGTDPVIHGDIGSTRLIPLSLMGEGMNRLLRIILRIANAQDGIVFIDEIENGFHYLSLEKIWKLIIDTARRYNTQVFATTHSRECIIAAHRASKKDTTYDFSFCRLERKDSAILPVHIGRDDLDNLITMEMEFR